jgi:hypothetical protein
MSAWHLINSSGRPACGQTGTVGVTDDREQVNCVRCKTTRIWREGLAQEPEPEETDWLSPEQRRHVDQQRRLTNVEVLEYLREGDLSAALARVQRGFERQCRMAGLDRALREEREKECV